MDLNVSQPERWASAFLGGAAFAYGLKRPRLAGLAAAVTGGALVYRGVTGRCPFYAYDASASPW